jgi:hypothetical protein
MTDSDPNVIPFPQRGDARDVAEELATRLREGLDPAAVLAQILDLGAGRGMLPRPRPPVLPPAPRSARRYRVRVDLDDARPPIWRRLELASDLTLAELHEVLQTAMGWTDSHLHHFLAGPKRDYTVQPFLTDYDEEEGDEGINERDVRLDRVLVQVGDRLFYEYDFGDGWEHTIRLEAIEEYDAAATRARVLGGRRACPPEDCGGIGGYQDLLAAMVDGPADADQRERLKWLGPFDPDAFSTREADQYLQLTLSSMGGSAGVSASLAEVGSGFSEVLEELVERSRREPKPLAALLAAAELTRLEEPDLAAKTGIVRPWLHLLEVVGAGVTLTPAGWLPPQLVHQVATDLDLLEPWMGKGNREQNLPPVRLLRETATSLGLLRKRKGELMPTALGTRLAGDTEALWRHVAGSLPLGRKPFERHAGAIMLLAVAAGEAPYDGVRRFGPDLLWSAGWSHPDGGPADESAAIEYARPTWDVLRVAGCDSDILRREPVSDAARQLARAALRDG